MWQRAEDGKHYRETLYVYLNYAEKTTKLVRETSIYPFNEVYGMAAFTVVKVGMVALPYDIYVHGWKSVCANVDIAV